MKKGSNKYSDQITKEVLEEALLTTSTRDELVYVLYIQSGIDPDGDRKNLLAHTYRLINRYGLQEARQYSNIKGKKDRGALQGFEAIFCENSTYTRPYVKLVVVQNNLMEIKCGHEDCHTHKLPDGLWRGDKIPYDLDHINGVNNDHRLENLRFLCKMCHAQTPTYAIKNTKMFKGNRLCPNCGERMSHARNTQCKKCQLRQAASAGFYRLTKEAIQELVDRYSIDELKTMFKMTPQHVKDHIIKMGIEPKPRGYWQTQANIEWAIKNR